MIIDNSRSYISIELLITLASDTFKRINESCLWYSMEQSSELGV